MTSNLGADQIEPAETEEGMQQMNQAIMQAVRSHFRPEFLNRLDDILIFRQLSLEVMPIIVDIQLQRLQNLLLERQIQLDITDEAKTLLAEEGFNPLYGARPLKRVIQNRIQDRLADEIIGGTIQEAQTVGITVSDGEYILRVDGAFDDVETELEQVEAAAPDEQSQLPKDEHADTQDS
jgi:ATP-dependent Clp protease ATP-binding subunit ClpB